MNCGIDGYVGGDVRWLNCGMNGWLYWRRRQVAKQGDEWLAMLVERPVG
jgi:hypothetical protein